MLLVLTLVGVAGMNTTLMEEKMAGNSQERTRSFEAAETGLAVAFSDPDAFDPNESVHVPKSGGSAPIGTVARYEANNQFKTWVENPPRGKKSEELWSHDLRAAHFEVTSTGTAGGDAETIIFGGGYQVARGK